jgi:serine/threonine protein kinase
MAVPVIVSQTLPPKNAPIALPPKNAPIAIQHAPAIQNAAGYQLSGHQSASAYQRSSGVSGAPNLPRAWAQSLELARDAHIGTGSFAKILKVADRRTGEKFAMKVIQRQFYAARKMENQLKTEVEAMQYCMQAGRTNHIVKLLDSIEDNGSVFLRMELCGSSLESYALKQPGRRLQEKDMTGWSRQLFCGLQDMHEIGIIHRDIKPENLLLGADGRIKIVDFGWCAWKNDLWRTGGALAGTFHFMAPEILEEGPQTEAVDVWSAGASILELLTGQPLITSLNVSTGLSNTDPNRAAKARTARALAEIRQKCPLPQHTRPQHISTQCWSFCAGALVPQVQGRITVASALSHVWLQHGSTRVPGNIVSVACERVPSWTPPPIQMPKVPSYSPPMQPKVPSYSPPMQPRVPSYSPADASGRAPAAGNIVSITPQKAPSYEQPRIPSYNPPPAVRIPSYTPPSVWDASTAASSAKSSVSSFPPACQVLTPLNWGPSVVSPPPVGYSRGQYVRPMVV